jgi:hypothetical protein
MATRRFATTFSALLAGLCFAAGARAQDEARPTVTVQIVSSGRQASVYRRVRLDTGRHLLRPFSRVVIDAGSGFAVLLPVPETQAGPYEVPGYEQLCFTPCRVDLAPGAFHLAVSQDGFEPIEAPAEVEITGPSRVETAYTSHRTLRKAGWITAGVGVTAGVGLIGASLYGALSCEPKDDVCERRVRAGFLGGAALALAAGAIGLGLAHVGDDVSIRVEAGGMDVAGRF